MRCQLSSIKNNISESVMMCGVAPGSAGKILTYNTYSLLSRESQKNNYN